MNHLWQRVQHRLFIVTLLGIGLAALLFGLLAVSTPAQADPLRQGPGPYDYSGDRCQDCHLDYKALWSEGAHSIAYDRESFQAAWAEAGQDPDCLQCHTTLFRPYDDTFLDTNIHCEACHGMVPDGHPPAEMVVNRQASACGSCHLPTFDEWRRSPHAFTEDMGTLACSTCHLPHGQNLRFNNDVDALCLNCHQSAPNTYEHLTHNEVSFENVTVTCASCHMYRSSDDFVHNIPDHTMAVETRSCTSCHEALSAQGNVPLLVDVDTALAAERDQLRLDVRALEKALQESNAQQVDAGLNYLRLTQGLIAGLGIGIIITWVLVRRSNTAEDSTDRRRDDDSQQ